MNQKSLNKKKTSEIFEGVNSSLHQAFIGAVERDKKKTICKHHFVEVREEFTDVNSYSKVQIIIYCENCGKVSHDKTLW